MSYNSVHKRHEIFCIYGTILWKSTMDLVYFLGMILSLGAWCASSERHSVFWNSSNPKFQWDDYTVKVHINDYLDIVCPHYPLGVPPSQEAERYVLYMVEQRDYDACRPQSYEQLRWECAHPFAPHAPERFSEKFQRYTPFTLGKEFRQGESYYYISKPLHLHGSSCLRLRVDVVGRSGSQESRPGGGGVHNSSNRLPADEPIVLPEVQRSVAAGSGVAAVAVSSFLTSVSVLLLLLLR